MVTRVTISLPPEQEAALKELARRWATTPSGAVTRLIKDYTRRQLEQEMAEGYAALAEENRRDSEAYLAAQAEVVLGD